METTVPHAPGTVRNLSCNCCGGFAGRFAQWWNMDTGYGICRLCAVRQQSKETDQTERTDRLAFRCGVEGVNWANAAQWARIVTR